MKSHEKWQKPCQIIFQKALLQKAAIRFVCDGKLDQASWYEHIIFSSGPYYVISASTHTPPDNLVLSNICGLALTIILSHFDWESIVILFTLLAYCLHDCKLRRNVSCLCHSLKMCWYVIIYFIINGYRKVFLCAALLFCQSALCIPFLCSFSLVYLPNFSASPSNNYIVIKKPVLFTGSLY